MHCNIEKFIILWCKVESLSQLLELEEEGFIGGFHQQVHREREKAWHDRYTKKIKFQSGGLVLLYDNKFLTHPGKFIML